MHTCSWFKTHNRRMAQSPDHVSNSSLSLSRRIHPPTRYVQDNEASKNFAFKCHRVPRGRGQQAAKGPNDVYSVNCIAFHPIHGTFATTGSDGSYHFWDKDSRQRLKEFVQPQGPIPIPCGDFDSDGNVFAYACSYDWSKGAAGAAQHQGNEIFLHACQDAEVKPGQKKTSGNNRRR